MRNENIAVIGDGSIVYSGEELRQDDELVWMHLIHLARAVNLGEPFDFIPHVFLNDISWATNGAGYIRLKASLDRMKTTALMISSTRLGRTISVSLIRKIEYSTLQGGQKIPLKSWRIWIETEMRILFDAEYLTRINFETYLGLRSGVARKLFLYWSSHHAPFPVKTETLMKLCSSRSKRKTFQQVLIQSLDELEKVGFISSWSFKAGLLTIRRAPKLVNGMS